MLLWDISDPTDPKKVRSGAAAITGHIAIHIPAANTLISLPAIRDTKPTSSSILDVSDPAHPKEAGRWVGWEEGRRAEAECRRGFHGPANVSPDGKMISTGNTPDVVNLDISDTAHPKLIGALTHDRALHQCRHAVGSYRACPWDRKLLYVAPRRMAARCENDG